MFAFLQKRDLKAVGKKFFHVLLPRRSNTLLKDCKRYHIFIAHQFYSRIQLKREFVCRLIP